MNTPEKVNLSNIGGGVANELFLRELETVLENMADINTDPKAAREINIKFKFVPNTRRDAGEVEVRCNSKLVGAKPQSSTMFIVHEGDGIKAYQHTQQELDFSNVSEIKDVKND